MDRTGKSAATTNARSRVVTNTSMSVAPASPASGLRPGRDLGIVMDLGFARVARPAAVRVRAGGHPNIDQAAHARGGAGRLRRDGPYHQAVWEVRAGRGPRGDARDIVAEAGRDRLHVADRHRAQDHRRLVGEFGLDQSGEELHQRHQRHGDQHRGDEDLHIGEPLVAAHGPVTWMNPVAAVTWTVAVAVPWAMVMVAAAEEAPEGRKVICEVPVTVSPDWKVLGKSCPGDPPCGVTEYEVNGPVPAGMNVTREFARPAIASRRPRPRSAPSRRTAAATG